MAGNTDGRKWPLAIDLFSGCGGLTLGLKLARFKVVGAIDNDPLAVKAYKSNHPSVRVWDDDIQKLRPSHVMRQLGLKRGQLDLLAGCPPCQGFSSIRTRNRSRRMRDHRNGLLLDFLRFARVMLPRAIMLENVPGLERHYRFKLFVRKLRMLGYHVDYHILNAARYGVPQRRRRLVLLASRQGHVPFAAASEESVTVSDTIGNLAKPGTAQDPLHTLSERRSARIMPGAFWERRSR